MARSTRFFAALATLGLVAGATGCIQEQNLPDSEVQATTQTPATEFTNWSKGDSQVDEYDFRQAVETLRIFEMWDVDGNGLVSKEEFERVAFRIWDADDSGEISQEEWQVAADAFHPSQQPYGEFADWDLDDDQRLVMYEMQQGFARTHLFRYWDGDNDGNLTRREFAEEAFAVWDSSDNGMIDRGEWDRAMEVWVVRFRRAPQA